jgi:hypothetical protein
MSDGTLTVRLLFVDEGSYHHEDVVIPSATLDEHERLIDCVREDAAVLRQLHVDLERLCAAWVVEK